MSALVSFLFLSFLLFFFDVKEVVTMLGAETPEGRGAWYGTGALPLLAAAKGADLLNGACILCCCC